MLNKEKTKPENTHANTAYEYKYRWKSLTKTQQIYKQHQKTSENPANLQKLTTPSHLSNNKNQRKPCKSPGKIRNKKTWKNPWTPLKSTSFPSTNCLSQPPRWPLQRPPPAAPWPALWRRPRRPRPRPGPWRQGPWHRPTNRCLRPWKRENTLKNQVFLKVVFGVSCFLSCFNEGFGRSFGRLGLVVRYFVGRFLEILQFLSCFWRSLELFISVFEHLWRFLEILGDVLSVLLKVFEGFWSAFRVSFELFFNASVAALEVFGYLTVFGRCCWMFIVNGVRPLSSTRKNDDGVFRSLGFWTTKGTQKCIPADPFLNSRKSPHKHKWKRSRSFLVESVFFS